MVHDTGKTPEATPAACMECGEAFQTLRPGYDRFCQASCRKSHNNRRMLRGLAIIDDAMAYNDDEVTKRVTQFHEEDRKRGSHNGR